MMQIALISLVLLLAVAVAVLAVGIARLKHRLQLLNLIGSKTHNLLAVLDLQTVRLCYASESLLGIIGIPHDELSKHDPKEVVHPDDLAFVQEAVDKKTLDHLHIRIRDARCGWQWYELYGFPLEYGNRSLFCFSYVPINDQMRISGELAEIKKQLSVILENSFDAIWKLDCQSRQLTLLSSVSHERFGIDDLPPGPILSNQEYFSQEDILGFRENLNRRIQKLSESGKDSDKPQNYYVNVKNHEGSVVRVLTRSTLEKNEVGIYTLYGVSRRVTCDENIS